MGFEFVFRQSGLGFLLRSWCVFLVPLLMRGLRCFRDRSYMFLTLNISLFFLVFMLCVSQNRRSTKRIQVFGFYRFMEAVKDRGRDATYCDKPLNRLARSRSEFSWQRVIRRYAPLHYTVQFVICHLTCAVSVRLTFVLDLISVFGGYIHRMWISYFCCFSPPVNT